ncbi:MAG: hypothetical protein H0W56_03995 [Acidothermales bacterium]|nr:hypothetical protein [Acidothermales bacterium]
MDPIVLEPVDDVVITTLVDNSYDGLMRDMGPARRTPMGRTPRVSAPQFVEGDPSCWPCLAWARPPRQSCGACSPTPTRWPPVETSSPELSEITPPPRIWKPYPRDG